MSLRVLVVEDYVLMQKIISFRFNKEGFHVTIVNNSIEALQKIAENTYDVVVSDLLMPGGSGFDLLHSLRSEQKNLIPVLILSHTYADENEKKAFEMGANDYMLKPFSPNKLVERVKLLAKKLPTTE